MNAPASPNILFLFTDQQRHDYVGYSSGGVVDTPNLDRLAARGMVFTHCCTNSPICAPARIGLATGCAPVRVAPNANRSNLPPDAPTYYQRLRDAGWHVGCVGKLDLLKAGDGRPPSLTGDRPATFGFGFTRPVELEGKWHSGYHAHAHGPYTARLAEAGLLAAYHEDYQKREALGYPNNCWDSILPEELWQDAYAADRAVEWIRNADERRPWHLFVSFAGPHDPFDPPKRLADKYRDRPMPAAIPGDGNKPAWLKRLSAQGDAGEIRRSRAQYCACIEMIDDQVGRILVALEERGMANDTIIVFSSDHGESLGDHGLWEKQTPYDPSIRVPLLVCGPGIAAGVSHELVELIDLAPTLCELGGTTMADGIDARSLAPILRDGRGAHREDVLVTMPDFHCLRDARWKYIRHLNDREELYDLRDDPAETRNVAANNPDVLAARRGRLRERLSSASA